MRGRRRRYPAAARPGAARRRKSGPRKTAWGDSSASPRPPRPDRARPDGDRHWPAREAGSRAHCRARRGRRASRSRRPGRRGPRRARRRHSADLPGASGGRARPPWARRWSPRCRARRPSRRARRAPGPVARTADHSAARRRSPPAPPRARRPPPERSGSATSTLGRQSARDPAQVPGGEPRIEGNRDGADLDRGEERRREADAVRQEQGDPLLGLDAARAQRVTRAVDEGAAARHR